MCVVSFYKLNLLYFFFWKMHVANGMKAFVKFLAQSQSIYIGLRSKNIKFVDENAFV